MEISILDITDLEISIFPNEVHGAYYHDDEYDHENDS